MCIRDRVKEVISSVVERKGKKTSKSKKKNILKREIHIDADLNKRQEVLKERELEVVGGFFRN